MPANTPLRAGQTDTRESNWTHATRSRSKATRLTNLTQVIAQHDPAFDPTWQEAQQAELAQARPFRSETSEEQLADLKDRLAGTRFAPALSGVE
jgi:hypothetical protein